MLAPPCTNSELGFVALAACVRTRMTGVRHSFELIIQCNPTYVAATERVGRVILHIVALMVLSALITRANYP